MKVSLFERMLKLYPELHNFLSIQYRMHEEIVKFPNIYFYKNKIENGLPIGARTNEIFNSKFNWPNEKIPLIFIHIEGNEVITNASKSKQNEEEAKIVTLFIEKFKNLEINFNNIGIITPYSAQRVLIQKKLKEKYKDQTHDIMNILKISSVDGFQGKEKDFIIVSNVRSNDHGEIGFLKDFRRLNVSITRAKYGMIIIGNINCLSRNSLIWDLFINYYNKNGLIFEPMIKKISKKNKDIIEYDINNLKKINIGEKKLESIHFSYPEYDFDSSKNKPDINEDLINNFECSENVYGEGNKKYYQKKKDKKNKKKKQFYY